MNANPLQTALQAKRPLPASDIEECRKLLEVEMLLTSDERDTWPGSVRQKCIRLLGHDLNHFLRCRQPEFGNQYGHELLEYQPDDLLSALEKRERNREIDELLDEIRHAQPEPRKWK